MNFLKLSWKNIAFRPLSATLSIILLALAIAMISLMFHVSKQLENTLNKNINQIDMVIGAKGSPLQLILSAVFQIDAPTGNIKLEEAQRIAKNPLVKKAIPLAYGDNFKGFRIVGTDTSYLALYQTKLKEGDYFHESFEVVAGATVASKLQLKVGDTFKSQHGFDEGGEGHDDLFKVVGILAPSGTVADKLLLTPVASVWDVHNHSDEEGHDEHGEEEHGKHEDDEEHHDDEEHGKHHDEHKEDKHGEHHDEEEDAHKHEEHDEHEDDEEHHHDEKHKEDEHDKHHDEKKDAHKHDEHDEKHEGHEDDDEHEGHEEGEHGAHHDEHSEEPKELTAMLIQFRSPMGIMQMPRYINEQTNMQAALPSYEVFRLLELTEAGIQLLRGIAICIMIVSALSVFVALYNMLKERKYEMALLRNFGASRWKLVQLVLQEGLILTLAGFVVGILLSRVAFWAFTNVTSATYHYEFSQQLFLPEESSLFGITLLIGLVASLLPAIQAFRLEISKVLAEG